MHAGHVAFGQPDLKGSLAAAQMNASGAGGQSVFMNSSPSPAGPGGPAGGPGKNAAAARSRWPAERVPASLVGAVAVVTIAAALVVVALVGAARGGTPGPGGTTRAVSVTATAAGTVDLQGVPGQVSIVGAASGRITLTGQLHWTGRHAPVAASRLDRAGHVLRLSYRCATASPCTESYRLTVPPRTAVILRQPSGRVILSGLAGPLSLTARSVNISATGLRCPTLAADITSGHLSATFDTAPRQVAVTLTSAQATLRLPASAGYAVHSQVASGYVHVGVPQASSTAHTVTATIVSGELELLSR